MIHKCFEECFDIDEYMKKYNERTQKQENWPGNVFRGFNDDGNDDDHITTIVETNIKHIHKILNTIKTSSIEHNSVTFSEEAVADDVNFSPIYNLEIDDCIREILSPIQADPLLEDDMLEADNNDQKFLIAQGQVALSSLFNYKLQSVFFNKMTTIDQKEVQKHLDDLQHITLRYLKPTTSNTLRYLKPTTSNTTQECSVQSPAHSYADSDDGEQ